MKILEIIKQLYKFNPIYLLGVGYDNALLFINHLLPLDIKEFPSGTKFESWTVPDEWVVKDAWVKFNGKKIIDYKKEPLSLMVYSQPFKGIIDKKEFEKHLYYSANRPDATPYEYSFYEKKWGICIPKNKIFDDKGKSKLKKGKYEVFIDTEFKPSKMKIGVHTIKGKSDKEILLFAHLDHPYQANDNLSGVACLIDLTRKLKCDHTIKIVFCPETIGSIAYVMTQDLSKVDFVIAVDICGNTNDLLVQWTYEKEHRLNRITDLAIRSCGENYRLGEFRSIIGSDEYPFGDPKIGIPSILLTRYPYHEYHSSDDKPEIINVEKIEYVQKVIQNIISIYEKDYIPVRTGKIPIMRSKYGVWVPIHNVNRSMDYLLFNVDGEKYLSDIVALLELNYEYCYDYFSKLKNDGLIYENLRFDASKIGKPEIEE